MSWQTCSIHSVIRVYTVSNSQVFVREKKCFHHIFQEGGAENFKTVTMVISESSGLCGLF